MSKQKVLDQIYEVLVSLSAKHPHGIRAIGSGNCYEVLTRNGIDGELAEVCCAVFETLENEFEGDSNEINPVNIIHLLGCQLNQNGAIKYPPNYECPVVLPGELDEHTLFTHPDPLFTAVNDNARRYGVEADASAAPIKGLRYFQDWGEKEELQKAGWRILTMWDAQEGRFLDPQEIAADFAHCSKN